MVSLISAYFASEILTRIATLFKSAGHETYVTLHTGNPGPAGTENKAKETTTKQVFWPSEVTEGEAAAGLKNSNAVEWTEVKEAETYKFISVNIPTIPKFVFYAELTEPKSVEKGNTFKFPIGSIVITA